MALIMKETRKITVGTAAVSVETAYRSFLMVNTGASPVYFREAGEDGAAVTEENGFVLPAGAVTPLPLCAKTLSLTAAADTDVRLLFVREG